MKRALKIILIVAAVLIVLLIALPFFIDVNSFRPQIESELSVALGRQAKVGNLSLSIITLSVAADDLSISDDPAFSNQPFVRAKALDVGVELLPLIFSKALHVTELTINQPQVSLLHNAAGKWNFSSLGSKSKTAPAARTSSNPDLSVGKLMVKNGTLSMADISTHEKPQVYSDVNITVEHFSFTSQFPFTMSANLPGGGNMKLDGQAGPIDASDASLTPLQAKITVNGMDVEKSGFVDPASGMGGSVDFNGNVTSNGHQAQASGTASVAKLKLSPKGSPAPKPVDAKFNATDQLQKQSGDLTADVTIGKAVAKLSGTYQMEAATTVLNMKLAADNMPVDDLETMLPALGVTLPSGSRLEGGTLTANFTITGPLDKLIINGPVQLANTKLAGFDLGNKLSAIQSLSGAKTGQDTVIQNFSTDAHVSPEGIQTQNVNLNIPTIGEITGNGTISPQNALNYSMNAKFSGGVAGGISQLASLGNKGAGIPFFIQGTTSDPKFVPNIKGMLGGQFNPASQGQGNLVNSITGLFNKKKPK